MSFLRISNVVTKSVFRRPATRLYPFERREPFKSTRGHIAFEIDSCIFCNLCAKKCPTEAIVCDRKEKRWQIDHLKCILCGNCVDSCRKGCLTQMNTPAPPMTVHCVEVFKADAQTPKEFEKECAKADNPAPTKGGCGDEDNNSCGVS